MKDGDRRAGEDGNKANELKMVMTHRKVEDRVVDLQKTDVTKV